MELLDYRPPQGKEMPKMPQRTRVVLHPNSETLWADLCSLNNQHGAKWTDMDALDVEAKILVSRASSVSVRAAHASPYVACDFAAFVPRSRPASEPRGEPRYQGVEPERPAVA